MVVADELGAAILDSGGDAIIAADAGGVIPVLEPWSRESLWLHRRGSDRPIA